LIQKTKKKHSEKKMNTRFKLDENEVCMDECQMRDVTEMFDRVPVIQLARKSFLSMTLSEPFTFKIPKIGMKSGSDMMRVVRAYWMPWIRTVYDWIRKFGICPYYFERKGEHLVPRVPDFDLGFITVVTTAKHELLYRWYWNHGTQTEQEQNMLWVITEGHPSPTGSLRSSLASLLPTYRSLIKLRDAQDVAATQAARPVHILEYHNSTGGRTADDDLTTLSASFTPKAAGLARARRQALESNEIRIRQNELRNQLRRLNQQNNAESLAPRTLWTDAPEKQMDEIDSGWGNRVIPLRPDFHYVQSAKPSLVADFYHAEMQFNTMAAAVMDFALELLTPTGTSRVQNVQGSRYFESERVREQTATFEAIIQAALVIAYRDKFNQVIQRWRISSLKGDPSMVHVLHPELDVEVDLSINSDQTPEELDWMWQRGLIKKRAMGERYFKNRNMPLEELVDLEYPDKMPREEYEPPALNSKSKKRSRN
jgi:virulence-associated protein VapD